MAPSIQTQPPEVYPASLAQRRLWFLDQLQGPTAAYNVDVGLWLYGPLNATALHSGFQEIVSRHESLRTTFRLEEGELLQVIAPRCTAELPMTDFAGVPEPYPEVYECAKKEVETPFDLSAGPLFRGRLIRIAEEEHVFLCTMHHSITDAWSMQVFVKELALLYEAFSSEKPAHLADLPVQYGDYSEWQQHSLATETAQQQLAYWKETLAEAPPVLNLPQDGPRPAEQSLQGARHTFPVPAEILAGATSLATRHHATPFMLLLAAFKTLLYRYSGESDVLVGVPVAGRSQVETEGLIGFFVDTVVLRDDLSGNPQFLDLLAEVRETTLAALANTEVPFERIVEALQPERDLSYNPIFQVMFSVIKSAVRSHAFGNLAAYPYVVNPTASIVDLFATFIEDSDGKWWLQFDYNTDLFRDERVTRMFDDFIALLRAITAAPEVHIDDVTVPNAPPLTALPEPHSSRSKTRGKAGSGESRDSAGGRRPGRAPDPAVVEQVVLAEIWKDVLGVPNVSIHDNFFDVGGHSLLAARLVAQIEDATGRKIPVSAIFRAPTVESLARLLRDDSAAKPDPLLMQLHRGQGGVPFFAIAAPGVESLGFTLLARNLGEDQAVYKLQDPGPLVWGQPFAKEELRSLAREYVTAMRTVQPHGPYCVGGMCDGVQIAQQMIIQLESEGEEVALFAIFDTWVLENTQIKPLWAVDYYLQRLRGLPDLPLSEQVASVGRVVKRLLGRNGSNGNGNGWRKVYWPGEDFQPPHFQAPVLLFKRPRQPFYYTRDPEMGWGARSSGGVEICEVDCGHVELLRQPHVQVVGNRLAHKLREINEQRIPSSLTFTAVQEQAGIHSRWTPTL